jgi:protoporphyrinogen/coproporphyrinogen III oxidase
MPSVAVIGAGLTGLSAAHRLARAGLDVTVYEAAAHAGGVVRSERYDGYLAELGPNSMAAPAGPIAQLITDLGLDADRVSADPGASNRYVVRGGRLVPLPTTPSALLTSPLLSAGAKLRLTCEPFLARGAPNLDESVADFVRRRMGGEVLAYLADPFISGTSAGDPERLSLRHALPKLHALEQTHGSLIRGALAAGRRPARPAGALCSFTEGLGMLPAALARSLGGSLRLGARVVGLERHTQDWLVTVRAEGDEIRHRHDAVIYAAPAHALAGIRVAVPGAERLEPLSRIAHPPVLVLSLGFRREDVTHPLDGFGALVPAAERRSILGVVFSSSLFPGRAPADHVLLTVFVGGAQRPELALADPAEATERAFADLGELLGVHGKPTFTRRALWRAAIPQYEIGHGRHLESLDALERDQPGLFFAGTYRHGISVGDALTSGYSTAERVAGYLPRA